MTIQNEISPTQTEEDQNIQDESPKKIFEFWVSERINKQGQLKWKIDHLQLNYFLRHTGFRRFDINNEYIFIQIKNHIIEEIPIHRIQDDVFRYLNSIVEEDLEGVQRKNYCPCLCGPRHFISMTRN